VSSEASNMLVGRLVVLGISLVNSGLLKKPDRLQRNLFQRSKPVKLAAYRAIDDCYNC